VVPTSHLHLAKVHPFQHLFCISNNKKAKIKTLTHHYHEGIPNQQPFLLPHLFIEVNILKGEQKNGKSANCGHIYPHSHPLHHPLPSWDLHYHHRQEYLVNHVLSGLLA